MTNDIANPEDSNKTIKRITSALTGFNSVADKIRDSEIKAVTNEIRTQLASALNMIFSLQQRISTIESEKHELVKQFREFKEKDALQSEYQMTQLENGSVVYVFREYTVGRKPSHAVCPNCFERKVISHFQIEKKPTFDNASGHYASCSKCDFETKVSDESPPLFLEKVSK